MEKKVNNKFTIFKLSLLITFLLTMIVTTVIMGNRSAVNAATAYDDNGIRWTFNYNSSTMEITNIYTTSLTAEQAENLVIPATLMYGGSEYTVRSIGYGSSYSSYQFPKTIKNLTIPDTVTTINNYAFTNQTQLEHVTWGTGITSIGNYAFYYCYNLEGDLPLREGMTTLGTSAFHYCNKLSGELIFPESLTSVASNSFYGCSSITGIKFGDNIPLQVITNIYGYENFQTLELYDDSELYKMEDGVLFSKDGKRLYLSAKTDYNNYVVPSDVTSIEPSAFRYAKSMTGTLTLNEGLLSIGNYAFYEQKDLTGHLRIPDSVTTIGSQSFYGCTNFDRVTIGSGITSIPSGTFSGLTDLFVNNVIGSVQFSNGYCSPEPVVHFLNSTKHLIVNKAPGVKLVNVTTGAEVETGDYLDETTFRYRIEVENGYSYNNLQLVWFDDNKYENYTNEAVVAGQEYEFTPLLRERSIFVQDLNNNTDLSLRTFITEINRTPLSKSRVPVASIDATFEYKHTKEPVKVKKGDLVTYKIRVYNEALQAARATEITVHIPNGMVFDEENITNRNYGWIQDGNTIKTSQLAFDDIHSYLGNGIINYKDVEICLTITEDSLESEVYKTVFAEITGMSGTDSDSTPGNVAVSQNYRIDEITNSNTTSFIFDQEDDDDFDTVVLNSKIRVEYGIRIEKVDKDTDELLAGARFELLSAGVNELVENGEVKTYADEEVIARVTSDENGIVDFGGIVTYGAGENVYWVKEIDAPSGYLTNIGKKMKVKVVKTILDEESGIYSVAVYCESSDYIVDTTHFEFTPVSNAEQLAKMGSGEVVNVDGVDYEYNTTTNYKLINDIDLAGINWEPIDRDLVGIINGDGHKISNLTINENEQFPYAKVGLLAEFTGIIENLTLENPNIHITRLAEGVLENTDYYGVGGFVGYMKKGYIYNCKTTVTEGTTASITSGMDNIGGFIGHTAPDGLVTIINSENNVDVTGAEEVSEEGLTSVAGTNNVGGLIGCSLGSISIQNSKNTGKIHCGQYGAGGLVGFVKPSDYEELSITAGYDEDNKRIDLLVENEAAKGQYNVTLEIRDRKTDRLIGGAIYEVDKVEDNIKTALVDTGSLKLFDKAIEYTGKDVYFMTEEETVPGYDLLNGIIRIDIDRYWDIEDNTYKVRAEASIVSHKEYEEFVGERSTKEDATKTGKIFERGSIFTEANIARANWNGSKIEIINCTNDGEISASKANAAGMIGTSFGVVTAKECTNNGEINGGKKSGGIVAELKTVDVYMYNINIDTQNSLDASIFTDCVNNGKVTGIESIGATGGIVAESTGCIKVVNGTNNGEISAIGQQVGGIVGKVFGTILAEDSTNNGKIKMEAGTSIGTDAGGIVGTIWFDEYSAQAIRYEQVNSTIRNCKSYGDFENWAGHSAAGIVGLAAGNSITITDCETKGKSSEEKLKIYSHGKGNMAGILAWSSCKHVTIKDCTVKNVETKHVEYGSSYSTDVNVAGIFANDDAGYIPSQNSYSGCKREDTNISNCIVEDCNITGVGKEVSGIMGITNGSYGYIDDTYMANIQDCKVKNSLVATYCEGYGGSGGGVVCSGIYAGGFECKGFNIRYCNIEDSRIEARGHSEETYAPKETTASGVVGRPMYSRLCNIEECNLINSTVYNKAEPGTAGNTGGIYGVCYGIYGDLSIKNCNVKNSNIIDHNTNPGGILGGIMQGYNSAILTIDGCNVIETNITRIGNEGDEALNYNSATNDCCVGGIAGSIQDMYKVNINNCKVIGKDIAKDAENASERNKISTKYGLVGGAVGMLRSNTECFTDITIKNYDIINEVDQYRNSCNQNEIGGFIGTVNSSDYADTFKNITIENVNVKGNHTANTAGFIANAWISSGTVIDNVNVKNTDISSNYAMEEGNRPVYGTIAGLVAANGQVSEYKNCKVEDCVISSKNHIAAGGIAWGCCDIKATNCTVKNVEIKDDWEEPETIDDVVEAMEYHRHFAGFMGVMPDDYKIELDNINVSNVDVNAKYATIGGIYGYIKNVKKLNDCTVKDCEFTSTKSISGVSGTCAGIGANTVAMNCEPTNNKVLNVEITTDHHLNAGAFGFIKTGTENKIKIKDTVVDNATLTHEHKKIQYNIEHREDDETALIEYDPVVSGLIGVVESDITINNATVKNSTITGKQADSSRGLTVAGIIAMSDCDITIDASKVINTTITNNTPYGVTGGFVGLNVRGVINNSKPDNDMTTTITNSSIEQNSFISGNSVVGGLVGIAKVNLDNDKVLNTTIKSTGVSAGAVALAKPVENTINRITVKDLTMPDGENLPYNIGGIAGVYYGTITNSTVTNADIYGSTCAAGVVAILNPNEKAQSSLDNITVTNATIVSKSSHAAGIACVDFAANITNVKVVDSTITSDRGSGTAAGVVGVIFASIDEAEIDNATITANTGMAGGIAGFSNNSISNIEVTDSKITGTTCTGGVTGVGFSETEEVEIENTEVKSTMLSAGGISGCGLKTIKNVSVKDSTIIASDMAGGVAGFGTTISDATVDNTNVTSDTSTGNGIAGGIAGSHPSAMARVTVKDSTITGRRLAGGISATPGELNNATVEGSTIIAKEMHAGGLAACTRSNITDCTTKNSTIKTLSGTFNSGANVYPTCLGGLVGTGYLEEPVITNSTVENNTLIGATGSVSGKYVGGPAELNIPLINAETQP